MKKLMLQKQSSIPAKSQSGFSLIELAVVLVITGLIAAAMPVIIPQISDLFDNKRSEKQVAEVSSGLKGFIISYSRLPCPDTNADGLEDCAAGAQVGSVPYKTLNLDSPASNVNRIPLAYGVYRAPSSTNSADADLATLKDRFQPILPKSEVSAQSNGLDFCWALRNATRNGNSNAYLNISSSGAFNQAYILADAGYYNADNDAGGKLFDGLNQTGIAFEDPQKPVTASYDDHVYSVGFQQLAGELGCQSLLSKVNGTARSAYASEDIYQLMAFYYDFRVFALRVKEHNLLQAQFSLAIATADLAIAAGSMATAIAAGIESFGVAAAATIAVAGVALALGINAEIDAVQGLSDSEDDVDEAKTNRDDANTAKANASAFSASQLSTAKTTDQNGWYQ